MKLRETFLFAIVLLIFSVMFARATRVRYFTLALDEAHFLESIDTTYSTGKPATFLEASVIDAVRTVVLQPASEVCSSDLAHPRLESIGLYDRHAFPVLYPLALLRFFTGSLNILVLCAVIAFPGLLACVYVYARRFGCPPWLAGILVLLTAAHPAWSYAAFGQFYVDKLFPFFCLIYVAMLYEYLSGKRSGARTMLLIGILAASTSERSAVMLAGVTGMALAWYSMRRGWRRANLAPLAFTAALALYAYVYMTYVQANQDYASFGDSAMNFLKSGLHLPPESRKFLAINFGLLFPFSIGGGMWTAMSAGSLLPNLIGTVGGAEKLGWTTHYHGPYFSLLIFAAILGAAAVYRRSRVAAGVCGALAVAQAVVLLMLNPLTPEPLLDLSAAHMRESALAQIVEFQIATGPPAGRIESAKFLRSVADLIPVGSEVSTTEGYMPALYQHGIHTIHFYPLGLGKSRYVIVPYYTLPSEKIAYKGHVSYLGPAVAEETNLCLTARLDAGYRVVRLFEEFPGGGTAVLALN